MTFNNILNILIYIRIIYFFDPFRFRVNIKIPSICELFLDVKCNISFKG